MYENLKKQIENLVKLQTNEIAMQNIEADLNDVPAKLDSLDLRLKQSENEMENNRSEINEEKKKIKAFESDLKENLSKIEEKQEKLGSVKTNKEYQSYLKEIENLKANNSELEDKVIECLDIVDELEKDIKKKNNFFVKLSEKIILEKEEVKKKEGADKKKLEELKKLSSKIASLVNSELLEKFFKVKTLSKNRVAIVSVENAVCSGCNLNIPPQMYNELQRFDSLQFCPFCHRIIYCKDQVSE